MLPVVERTGSAGLEPDFNLRSRRHSDDSSEIAAASDFKAIAVIASIAIAVLASIAAGIGLIATGLSIALGVTLIVIPIVLAVALTVFIALWIKANDEIDHL